MFKNVVVFALPFWRKNLFNFINTHSIVHIGLTFTILANKLKFSSQNWKIEHAFMKLVEFLHRKITKLKLKHNLPISVKS